MYATDLLNLLEREVAPVALSDEYCKNFGHYDNSGIIINSGAPVKAVLFSLDLSKNSVDEAIAFGANCIVTHHPAIYGGVKKIDLESDPLSQNLARCISGGISVISMHLNFDAAVNGIDYYLMRALGGESCTLMDKLSVGGYGRVYGVKEITFGDLCLKASNTLNTGRASFYGDENKKITKIASFCGAGGDETSARFAVANGAQAFVSSDMQHHVIAYLVQKGACVINLTHYSSESYGLGKISEKIIQKLSVPARFFADAEML